MSNFIYNDNFSTSNDYEQNLISNDDSSEKKLSNRFLVTICIACAVFSLLFGVLGGVLVSRNMAPIKTDVYTNTIYRAPAASSIVAGDG